MEDQSEWPLIVRAVHMKSLPTGSPAAVEVGLSDAAGHPQTLRLSSAAVLTLRTFLSHHLETKVPLLETMPDRPFRIDPFAPAINIVIDPRGDQDGLMGALSALATDHPNFDFAMEESGGIVLGGVDERQLAEILNAVEQSLGVKITASKAQAAYREQITQRAEIDYTHKKQVAGAGEFARVKLVLEPTPGDYGCTFNAVGARHKLRDDFIAAVEYGVRRSLALGPLGGFPVIGMRVMFVDGAAHDSDSNARAFEAAAVAALTEALQQAKPQFLEPILRVEITTPERYFEAIMADLKGRGGASDGRGRRSRNGIAISALMPASNFIGYADALSKLAEAHGDLSAQFDRYAPVHLHLPDDPYFRPAAALRA